MSSRENWFKVVGIILSLLVGLAIGVVVFGSLVQSPKTFLTTIYETKRFTETIYSTQSVFNTVTQTQEITKMIHLTETETQILTKTITKISYSPIKVPYEPDVWREEMPTTILNPDFEYEDGEPLGVLPCNDWCGFYVLWVPKLTEEYLKCLPIVSDETETVVIMHPLSEGYPSILVQPLSINNTKQYILNVRVRNVALCDDDSSCGDSILIIKLVPIWKDEIIQIAKITLDTRSGWIERSYDITDLIKKSEYFKSLSDAWLVIEVHAGGPRGIWSGEWTAIDYIELEVK